MAAGDLKHMSLRDFAAFIVLVGAIASIGSLVVIRLWTQMTMTFADRRLQESSDMVEMQNLLSERQYLGAC